MALVLFESRVNMITVATPSSVGGVVVGYDETLGVLTQKDHFGVITPIGSGSGIGSLAQTLSIGRTTGTNSIFLDANTRVRSSSGSGSLRLDNGSFGNYVQLSSSATGSTLTMDDNTIQITGLSSSVQMDTTDIRLNFGVNQFLLQNNNSYLKLGSTNVLEFTTATTVRATGNRVPAFISSNASRFSNTVTNSVIIGGTGIIGTQSNSVYVPNLIVKDGGYVKGISGDGQLRFNSDNEAYITSGTNIIGILGANGVVMSTYNGIFITDNIDTITTTPTIANAVILSSNTIVNDSLTNTVVIGGQSLIVDSSDTVYLGGTVDIDNQYKLPTSDGTSGQFIRTDGDGNLTWSSGAGSVIPVITVTAAQFALVSTLSLSSTYRITDADFDLYGGTEIYLTTNSQGILNDVGEGRFFNPKYDQTVDGYRIWAGTSSSYATGSVVYWGGRAWSNISGVNTLASVDIFSLNSSEWTLLSYTNTLHYNISYDKIKYDRLTDKIIYRNERGTNIVSTNTQNISYWIDDVGLYNPIKVFQWGNVYRTATGKGIGSQDIINSYNENINFRGVQQTNLTMNNLSSQYNFNTGTSSVQDNLILNNYSYDRQATLLGSEFNMSFQSGNTITIDGDLMVQGTTTTVNSENLIVKDPIIILAASQSGTPTLDSGLFINRGIGATQAFIWDESMDEFKFISTPSGATVSGNVSITDYTNVRTGVLKVGTGDFNSNDRFLVSSSGGTVSLIVDESGSVYNRGRGGISTNTAFGESALSLNVGGYENTAIGVNALLSNTSGSFNTALGLSSLRGNIFGASNTAIGDSALYSNTGGDNNTAIGRDALYFNISGDSNIALGSNAGTFISGSSSGATNSENSIFIGSATTPQLNNQTNQIVIGVGATGNGSNTVTLGNDSITKTYLKGTVYVGKGLVNSNDRFVVSSSGGTVSLIVDENGYVYNRGRGGTATNTAFGFMTLGANTTGNRNTAFGASALSVNTSGSFNTAIGHESLNQNISGSYNIAVGANSLRYNRASLNTAVGYQSLQSNTNGNSNTAVGYQSLLSNTSEINTFGTITPGSGYVPGTYSNVQLIYATGSEAISYPKAEIVVDGSGVVISVTPGTSLGSFIDSTTIMTISNSFLGGSGSGFEVGIGSLSTGSNNTAIGSGSLLNNTSGSNNTAVGQGSLDSNAKGIDNTAVGQGSLQANSTGNYNTAVGKYSMYYNTTGDSNVGIGWQSLPNNTTGYQNTGLGRNSLFNNRTGVWNTAVGDAAIYYNTSGNCHTGLGLEAGHRSTTGVSVLGTFSSGNGYTPGTYSGVQLKYSSGPQVSGVAANGSIDYYPLATIVVGTGGTISSVTLETSGRTFATSSTIMTSTASEIGPGTGFTVTIASIQTAENNTAVGFKSLYYNTIGSNNVSFGHEAGNFTNTPPYFNHISDNSVYIGYYARAKNSNETNQIVIGYEAYGNGSNTVTLGNDSIIKTYLKGSVQLPTGPTTSTGTYSILTRNDITGEVEKIVPMYKVYTALLTQSGTASPTVDILENTLGGTIVWTRNTTGDYHGTLTGAFPINKVVLLHGGNSVSSAGTTISFAFYRNTDNRIVLSTLLDGVPTDSVIDNLTIEVRVYN